MNSKTEYDQIKGMLNTIRTLNESKNTDKNILKEDIDSDVNPSSESSKEQYDDVDVINDGEVKVLSKDKEDR